MTNKEYWYVLRLLAAIGIEIKSRDQTWNTIWDNSVPGGWVCRICKYHTIDPLDNHADACVSKFMEEIKTRPDYESILAYMELQDEESNNR